MLAPDDRALLLDGLRPPPGFRLERAVGTTFTLDLETALTVPLAFAGYALTATPDPIAIMEALRSSADRLDVFFQAGAVQIPRKASDLVALLEAVVHEVRRPRPGHLFHPKTWVAHYVDASGDPDASDRFRVLVLSRNLTGDCSWDVVVRLDGEAARKRNRDNDGLVRFVAALVDMAKDPLPDERSQAIRALADRLHRVEWEMPEGVREARFWPFGLPAQPRSKLDDLFRGYRHLVISPFVTPGGLTTILRPTGSETDATIVSRPEELDRLPREAFASRRVYVIDPLAGLDPDAADATANAQPMTPFGALHAKVILVEINRRARLFLGSANATDAAFDGNVEMMVELEGGPSQLGIDRMLGEKAEFKKLLVEYQPPAEPVVDEAAEVGRRLDAYLVDVAQLRFLMTVEEGPGGWRAALTTDDELPSSPLGVETSVRPFNRPLEEATLTPGARVHVELAARVAADLTPFLVLIARTSLHGHPIERSGIVKATLAGGPTDRLGEILARQIDTPEKFLRLLFLLLGLGTAEASVMPNPLGAGAGAGSWGASSAGVFETLVRALATDPTAIDRLDEIVRRLMAGDREREAGARILPAGWERVWQAVTDARKLLGAPA